MASPGMLARAELGIGISALIAAGAHRARSLDTSGAVAATCVGTAACAAGWNWALLLILYFVVSSLISRFRHIEKHDKTSGVIEKTGARDATQVIANGGLFAFCALAAPFGPKLFTIAMTHAALGALAASAADTWATEIGTLLGGTPRSLRGFKRVPPGTSGALSIAGTLAMVAGAAFVASVAAWTNITPRYYLVAGAGIAGALADSIIGATVQERRWCDTCNSATERRVHTCGSTTRLAGGRNWADNDFVNLVATFAGAAVAAGIANL